MFDIFISLEKGRENCLFIHVTLVPWLSGTEEHKSKPTQHSVKELQSLALDVTVLDENGEEIKLTEDVDYTENEGEATFKNGLFYRARHRSGRWKSLKPNPWPGPSFGGPGAPRECAYAHYSRVKGADRTQLAWLRRAIDRENAANGGFETWGASPNWYYEWAGWGTLTKRRVSSE